MLQDRNTNVKVDAWIKQFNEEQKVQDQRIANLEETEKTVQNATCFDGCTSAQWKDYIANNPATDIETDNFRVHNNTSEIKMGSNVELKSGSSKVEVDGSSVKNETQFTNQFSEVSKAKTEIYSGDDSTHFEAKAECGPEGKSSYIRVSADYSLLHTSVSNADFGNYYFSNQKAEFTFPSHRFEFCCDGRFFIDGQPSSANNAICFDGCDGDCWRDYIAAQIPAKAQDSYCFDGCDGDCWRDYIDSKAGSSSSITSPDCLALVTTTHCVNKIYMCDPDFTFGYTHHFGGRICFNTNCCFHFCSCNNQIHSEHNILNADDVENPGKAVCNEFHATSFDGCLASNVFRASGGCGVNSFFSDCCNTINSKTNSLCATSVNIISAYPFSTGTACNCLVAKTENYLSSLEKNTMKSCINCMCASSTSGDVRNILEAWSDSGTGQNYLRAKTNNLLWSEGPNYLQALCNELEATNRNVLKASRYNQIKSGEHCWEFCADGNLYKDGVCVL